MTYIGLLHGAIGIQYFVRSEGIFPAPAAWSEIRIMAQEVRVLTPALLDGDPVPVSTADSRRCSSGGCASSVIAKAWTDRDGSIVVVAANTATSAGPPCSTDFVVSVPNHMQTCSISAMFDAGGISTVADPSSGHVTFTDSLTNFGTNAYRVDCSGGSAVASPNLVYNGGYEIEMNPGVPDGNYLGNYQTGGGFYFGEYRDSVSGRASLRLTARHPGTGVTLSPYTIPRVNATAGYKFSIWIKGAEGGEKVALTFNPSIFPTTQGDTVLSATTKWVQKVVELKSTADPSTACPYNCRSWLSYQLSTAGTVWLDDMTLSNA